MAIGAIIRAGTIGGQPTFLASVKGQWVQCHDNLEATAESATVLLKPWSAATSSLHWVKVPDGATRILIRAKNDAAATTFTTDARVRMFGAFTVGTGTKVDSAVDAANGFSGTPGDANFAEFLRLDSADANANGQTLVLTATGNLEDASFEYSDPPDLTGYDLKGAQYVGMLPDTAANVTGGAAHGVYGELIFLN